MKVLRMSKTGILEQYFSFFDEIFATTYLYYIYLCHSNMANQTKTLIYLLNKQGL